MYFDNNSTKNRLKSQAVLLVRDWHQNAPDLLDTGNIPLCRFVITPFPELFQVFEVIPPLQCVRLLPDSWRFVFIMPFQPNIQLGGAITPQMPSFQVLPRGSYSSPWLVILVHRAPPLCFCNRRLLHSSPQSIARYEYEHPRLLESAFSSALESHWGLREGLSCGPRPRAPSTS